MRGPSRTARPLRDTKGDTCSVSSATGVAMAHAGLHDGEHAGETLQRLQGRKVLVTGGGRGIGRAIALLCAEEGGRASCAGGACVVVCKCACMSAFVHVCMCACVLVCLFANMCLVTPLHTHTHTHTHTHVCICRCAGGHTGAHAGAARVRGSGGQGQAPR